MYRKIVPFILLVLLLAGCLMESGGVTATPTTVSQTIVATSVASTPTLVSTATPAAATPTTASETVITPTAVPASIDDLLTMVSSSLPVGAFDGVQVLELNWPQDERPLAAVYSVGFRNFDLEPTPEHFVAIYTQAGGQWQELAFQSLNELGGPDYLPEEGVTQVALEPGHLWLSIEGYVGAHSGAYVLLQFDGGNLEVATTGFNSSQGVADFEDLNGDGTPEVILRQHDYYVFCYACGLRYLNYGVFTWNEADQQLQPVQLRPLPADQQTHPAYTAVNRAVELATADLWPAAQAEIAAAQNLAAGSNEPLDAQILEWNATLIDFYHETWQAEMAITSYPLLTHIFYGDFEAALNIARAYPADQILATPSPLVAGTIAEGNEQWLADYMLQQTNAAVDAQPDLAAAYYFRAWATALRNPADPQIDSDLAQAAALDPAESLYAGAGQPAISRIQFAAGATSAQISGSVTPGGEDVYVLTAQAGQRMTVDVFAATESVRLVVHDAAGDFVDGQVTPQLWLGELPQTGDYLIRVRNDDTAGDASNYTLNVNIPARITFEPGAILATVGGSLDAHQSIDYILRARAGQTMDVVIESDTDNVLLTVVGADGIPLTNGLMSGATSWRGELLVTQDYILRAIGTFDATDFTLTVTIE